MRQRRDFALRSQETHNEFHSKCWDTCIHSWLQKVVPGLHSFSPSAISKKKSISDVSGMSKTTNRYCVNSAQVKSDGITRRFMWSLCECWNNTQAEGTETTANYADQSTQFSLFSLFFSLFSLVLCLIMWTYAMCKWWMCCVWKCIYSASSFVTHLTGISPRRRSLKCGGSFNGSPKFCHILSTVQTALTVTQCGFTSKSYLNHLPMELLSESKGSSSATWRMWFTWLIAHLKKAYVAKP